MQKEVFLYLFLFTLQLCCHCPFTVLYSVKYIEVVKFIGQATAMYERYAEEGIIHWSTMEILCQTVKGAYLQRRKQGESSNHVSIGRLMDFSDFPYK